MAPEISAVLEYGAPEPGETAVMMEDKLRFHTDSWDLSVDLRAGLSDIVVIDARSRDAYAAGHIPGAVSFPHREMSAETTAPLDRSKVYVVYCDGIGCNASTKGAYKLAGLGFRVKELLGGIDWWRRDGHPVTVSHEPGSSPIQGVCGPKMVRGSAGGLETRSCAGKIRVACAFSNPADAEEIALDRARSGAPIFPDATERQSAPTESHRRRGTGSSNPGRSSGESAANPVPRKDRRFLW